MRIFIWWLLFTIAAIWAQSFMPGIDFLAPAIIVCLQMERLKQAIWLTVAFLILQEGMGTLAFGAGLLWYGALIMLYFIGRWLFESKNILFVFFIGISLGIWHFILLKIMGQLENLPISTDPLLRESALQVAVFTIEWGIVYSIYKRLQPDERTL
jgi:hypothetical protein